MVTTNKQCAYLSLLPNLVPNQSILCSVLVLFALTFPTVLLPGSRHQSTPTTFDPTFPYPSQSSCVADPEATCPSSDGPCGVWSLNSLFFALPSLSFNFLRLSQTFSRPPPLAQTKSPVSCYSIFLALAWFFPHIFDLSWSLYLFPSI